MLDRSEILSAELWTQVFLRLSLNQWQPHTGGLRVEDFESYPDLHRLKLVCKKFRDVFLEHHELSNVLFMRQNLKPQALPGLLTWLQRHSNDIGCLVAHCGDPYVNATLTHLTGTQKLTATHIHGATAPQVQILSMCASVNTCTLSRPPQDLDVNCLKTLPKLTDLHLERGVFYNVPLTSQLTLLVINKAGVYASVFCKQGCGLQALYMTHSEVNRLQDGICARTALKSLSCKGSLVTASQDACKLATDILSSTDLRGLTALRQLKNLELETRKAYPSLQPVYVLDLLEHLHITGDISIHVTAGLSRLSNLTSLQITGASGASRPLIKLDVQWHNMRALQEVHVVNVNFVTIDMVALTDLNYLRTVDFENSQPAGSASMRHFANMIHSLGLKRPGIRFLV
ncbi:hypothetical protein ABBQ38_009046 [Trebouxia sp. C0009 RCD-2024]